MLSTPLVGFVADQFAQRSGKPKITLVAVQVAAFKLPVALCFFCLADPRSGSFWVLYACFVALQSVSAPVVATLQQLSPPTLRGADAGHVCTCAEQRLKIFFSHWFSFSNLLP